MNNIYLLARILLNMFKPVDPRPNFPKIEERIIEFWKKNKIFEKSIELRSQDKQWTFLDGPPFITGLPHYGSLLSSIPKDVFPRFYTMRGYRVRRVWGWDCHGLPAENKVEEKLRIKRKKDIEEKVGIKKFIDECKRYVSEVSSEWEWYIDHIGRWVDFKNAYKTMDRDYMETVMWVFKQLYDKGLIYKGLRVSLYCPHCVTAISNFEVAMDADNYKQMTDPATVYKYPLEDERDVFLLAWSTTPWNKLATPALAVNPQLTYLTIQQGGEKYILAEATVKLLKKDPYKVIAKLKGKDLIGKKFIPHYDFYQIDSGKRAFTVVGADFVTADHGTGIVTIAAYGEEDLAVMQANNIQIVLHVDEEGVIKKEVPKFGGMYYLDADKLINEDLMKRGLIYRESPHTHAVATCWRCQTRLFYAPQDAWYVDIKRLKPRLKETNEKIDWVPAHFKYGRFLKSMEAAPDWCISRSRYWGSPVPVWECTCGERFVPGSIEELAKSSGQKISDLHKPEIDEIVIVCKKCGRPARRVPEVLDSWIEAGSAPFAERHFPFEKDVHWQDFFPPDFITEYTGQIRAWFYVLHVIGTALYDSHAFDHVLVTGVILGTDGRKMSKNYGNYPDPKELLAKYGADALRLYLMGSPVMNGEDIRISEVDYRSQVGGLLLVLWNVYNFLVTYANIDNWQPTNDRPKSSHVLDRWILSRLEGNIKNLTENGFQKYNTPEIVGQAWIFMRDLSSHYVRGIRERVSPSNVDLDDKNRAHQTLWYVLVSYTRALAPLIPFITEEIYKNLTDKESVHLSDWPDYDKGFYNDEVEKQMQDGIETRSEIFSFRKRHNVKVQIPLKTLDYKGPRGLTDEIDDFVLEQGNVYKLVYKGKSEKYMIEGLSDETNQDKAKGKAREIIHTVQSERKKLGFLPNEYITLTLPEYPKEHEEWIRKKVMARDIKKGDKLQIYPERSRRIEKITP